MPQRQAQRPDDARDGRENDDVGNDIVDGVGVPKGGDVDAGARWVAGLVPEVRDGRALEDGGDDRGKAVSEDDDDAAPARAPEPWLREDAEVEAEDGELGQVDAEFVEDLVEVEHLWRWGGGSVVEASWLKLGEFSGTKSMGLGDCAGNTPEVPCVGLTARGFLRGGRSRGPQPRY